jgi:hypothetical protein
VYKTIVIKSPITAKSADPCKVPKERTVAGFCTTTPELTRPINAMNKPIPTATAFRRLTGIAVIIASRTLKNERRIKK